MQRKILIWAVALVFMTAASAADKEEVSPDKFVFSNKPGEAGYVTELMFLDKMEEADALAPE